MGYVSSDRLRVLEPWSPPAFFAGGLLVIGFVVVTALDLPGITVVVAVFGLLVAIGLGGLHPHIATAAPRLALAAAATTVAAIVGFGVDLVVTAATTLADIPAATLQPAWAPPPAGVALLALELGLILYGVGSLWTDNLDRLAGLLLVVAGLSLPVLLAVEILLGDLPGWLVLTGLVAFAVTLILAGLLFDIDRVLADGVTPITLPAATEGDSSWTNEYVREGYEVDGAESRTVPIRMATRLQVARLEYELLATVGEGIYRNVVYPLVRRLGGLVGRRVGAEQYVAEREYLMATVTATDRAGMGSPYWRFGLAVFVGLYLVGLGGGWALGSAAVGATVVGASVGLVLVAGGLLVLASLSRTLQELADQA